MTNGNERFEQIGKILEQVASSLRDVAAKQQEMVARQQYHDEAFERQDADMKGIKEAILLATGRP